MEVKRCQEKLGGVIRSKDESKGVKRTQYDLREMESQGK